jgi:hypothetical protein
MVLNNLSPQQREGMAANRILNTTTGETGVQTPESFGNRQRTATATTATQARVAEAGQEKVEGTPIEQLGAAGERAALGQTATETRAGEARAGTVESYQDYAKRFLADPTNSAWGKMLTSIGLDPQGVTEAFATGQDAVLGGVIELKKVRQQTGESIEEYLAKRRIDSAKVMSERLGNRVPIRTILTLEQAVETGQNPFSIGVSGQDVALWLKAREIGSGAYLREQISKENPNAKLLEQMVKSMKDFSSTDQLNTVNNAAAWIAAQTLTEGDLGPRPTPESPEDNEALELRQIWDERARYHYSTLGIIGKSVDKILGIPGTDILNPDDYTSTQLPGFLQGTPADTTGTGRPGAQPADGSATTTPGAPGAPKSPMFQDPGAAAAVQGILNMSKDSSLFRR